MTGIRVADLPDLGAVSDAVSFVAEHAGAGRVQASASRTYFLDDFLLSVKEYGAVGDNIADDTAAIQDTIDAAIASGRGVRLPAGTYKVSAPLTWTATTGFKFCGDGQQVSILAPTTTTANVFTISSDSYVCPVELCSFSVLFANETTVTAGRIFDFTGGCGGLNMHDVMTLNGYTVIYLAGGIASQSWIIRDLQMLGFQGNGIEIALGSAGGGLGYVSNILMSCNPTTNTAGTGLLITSGQGMNFHNMQMQGMKTPVLFQASNGNFITDLSCTSVFADGAAYGGLSNTGWTISSGLGQTRRILLTNCWAGAGGSHGFTLDSVDEITMVNCKGIANKNHGLNIMANCTNIAVTASEFVANSQAASGVDSGIAVTAPVGNLSLIGNRCGPSVDFPTSTQAYGIIIGTGATNEYIISLNRLAGNVTGGLIDGGTGGAKFVDNNLLT